MELKFLMYVLHITLVSMREKAYEPKDKQTFWLCDMLHNTPLYLDSETNAKEAYQNLLDTVNHLGIEKWLEVRKEEFYNRFPEYKEQNLTEDN
jgi:hypothetical protein